MNRKYKLNLLALNILSVTSLSHASDFNLPFVNAAGLGVVYSDWATSASDASTEFTNPAGLIKLQRPQLVLAPLGILGTTKFSGNTTTPSFPFAGGNILQSGSANSRISAFMPSFYYSYPVTPKYVLGFGITAPFALGTNYPKDSIVRYTSTRSQVLAVNIGPALGVQLTDKFSLGLGLDAMRLSFQLSNIFGPPVSMPFDSENQNHLKGWGFGFHAGLLYQLFASTRLGISYNSSVMIHSTGDSETFTNFGEFRTDNQKTNAMLPAHAQLSLQQDITPLWTVMTTFFYTRWGTFDKITLKRMMLPGGEMRSVTIPFEYHNAMNYTFGTTYKVTPQWLLRTGIEFMNTPSNKRYRAVADPIGRAIVVGIGAHYQQNLCLSYDFGYGHSFFKKEPVNLIGPLTINVGHNRTQTNVIGVQMNWNV